jgi:hypothetical protein
MSGAICISYGVKVYNHFLLLIKSATLHTFYAVYETLEGENGVNGVSHEDAGPTRDFIHRAVSRFALKALITAREPPKQMTRLFRFQFRGVLALPKGHSVTSALCSVKMIKFTLGVVLLAYLGVLLDLSMDRSGGFSWERNLKKWIELKFFGHLIVAIWFGVYLILKN